MTVELETESCKKTKNLITCFRISALAIGALHVVLLVLTYYSKGPFRLWPVSSYTYYAFCPVVSVILTQICSTFLLRFYRPKSTHKLLIFFHLLLVLTPYLVPTFLFANNIIHTAWSIILSFFTIVFLLARDFCYVTDEDFKQCDNTKLYEELRFYLDKGINAFLTLVSVLSVCMTILWTAPENSFKMTHVERAFWAIYMLLCFSCVFFIGAVILGYPIIKDLKKLRHLPHKKLEKKKEQNDPNNEDQIFVSSKKAAELLGLSVIKTRDLARSMAVKAKKVKGRWRYSIDSLNEFKKKS